MTGLWILSLAGRFILCAIVAAAIVYFSWRVGLFDSGLDDSRRTKGS